MLFALERRYSKNIMVRHLTGLVSIRTSIFTTLKSEVVDFYMVHILGWLLQLPIPFLLGQVLLLSIGGSFLKAITRTTPSTFGKMMGSMSIEIKAIAKQIRWDWHVQARPLIQMYGQRSITNAVVL